MFSSSLSGTKPATGGLFGQSTQPQQPQVSQFGTTITNNNTNTTSTGGLFGNSNNTNSNTGSTLGGGLFGNKPSTASGGLFGNNNTTSGPTGGLFGNNNNNTSTNTGGLFGSSLNNNNNTSNNMFGQNQQQQQQPQQQSIMQPQLLAQKRQRKLIFDQPRLLPSWTKLSDDSNQPTREVIRRLTNLGDEDENKNSNIDDSDSDIEFEEDIFGNVGFGKVKKTGSKRLMNKSNMSILDVDNDSPSLKQSNLLGGSHTDIPPMKSLYDIEKELEIDSKIQQRRSNHSFMDQEVTQKVDQSSKDFNSINIFDRSDNKTHSNTNIEDEKSTTAETDLYSCIIFGYPENIATQVISHFNKYGEILEDFPFLTKTKKHHNKVSIQTGDSWCKITYDNKVSYARALKENGTQYSGYVIGCIPFTKTQGESNKEQNVENVEEQQSGFLKEDIFQKGGVTSMIEKHLKNERKLNESGNKITVKLNEMLFGFGNGEKEL